MVGFSLLLGSLQHIGDRHLSRTAWRGGANERRIQTAEWGAPKAGPSGRRPVAEPVLREIEDVKAACMGQQPLLTVTRRERNAPSHAERTRSSKVADRNL